MQVTRGRRRAQGVTTTPGQGRARGSAVSGGSCNCSCPGPRAGPRRAWVGAPWSRRCRLIGPLSRVVRPTVRTGQALRAAARWGRDEPGPAPGTAIPDSGRRAPGRPAAAPDSAAAPTVPADGRATGPAGRPGSGMAAATRAEVPAAATPAGGLARAGAGRWGPGRSCRGAHGRNAVRPGGRRVRRHRRTLRIGRARVRIGIGLRLRRTGRTGIGNGHDAPSDATVAGDGPLRLCPPDAVDTHRIRDRRRRAARPRLTPPGGGAVSRPSPGVPPVRGRRTRDRHPQGTAGGGSP